MLQILRQGHRAGRLIDDLLAITRLEQGIPLDSKHFDLVPLTAAAAGQTRELAPAVNVQLHAPSHVHLHGDPERIRQILDNLLSNARHATPNGGQITIRVTGHTTGVQVEVTDTGPGVPKPDRERIFQRFTRLNGTYLSGTDGNGLGLAIARSIATAHSGTLTCEAPDRRASATGGPTTLCDRRRALVRSRINRSGCPGRRIWSPTGPAGSRSVASSPHHSWRDLNAPESGTGRRCGPRAAAHG